MGKLLLLAVLMVSMASAQNTVTLSTEGTLRRAEKLTDAEKSQLAEAKAKLAQAQADYQTMETQIAANHKMAAESYMEWSHWYELDGDWILERYHSNMYSAIFTNSKPQEFRAGSR